MGQLNSDWYDNGMVGIIANVLERTPVEILRYQSISKNAGNSRSEPKLVAETSLRLIKRQVSTLENISNMMATMRTLKDDKEIINMGNQISAMIGTLGVNSGNGNPGWRLTSQEKQQMHAGIRNLTATLRRENVQAQIKEEEKETKDNSFFGRFFNKSNKEREKEEAVNRMVEAMSRGVMDTNGQPINGQEQVQNDVRMRAFAKVGVLTFISALAITGMLITYILLTFA